MPPIIVEWSKRIQKLPIRRTLFLGLDLAIRLDEIIIRLCTLLSILHSSKLVDSAIIVPLALSIEADLAHWVDHLIPEYAYTIIPLQEASREVYSDNYHVYPQLRIARIWAHYRCSRILVHEVILDTISPLSLSSTNLQPTYHEVQRRTSERLLATITSDICASVPLYLGYNNCRPTPAAAGTFFLWPLSLVATRKYTSRSMREWVILQLDKIGDIMGIQQATTLARVLRTRKKLTAWDTREEQ